MEKFIKKHQNFIEIYIVLLMIIPGFLCADNEHLKIGIGTMILSVIGLALIVVVKAICLEKEN